MPATAPTVALSDGTRIPVIGLGTYKGRTATGVKGNTEVEQAVKDAIDAGYRHIDTAIVYQCEDEVGRAVRAKVEEGVVRREDLYICTKLWNTHHRPDLVGPACRQSLENLGLDYIDLYLMHWPTAYKEGPEAFPRDADGNVLFSDVDIVDTYRAMEELVAKGLVRSIGVSNFNSVQLRRLLDACTIRPVVNQVECHPHLNQKKLIAACREFGVQVVAFRPFGAPGIPDHLLQDATVAAVGRRHGKGPGQVILRYLIQIGVIPIPKSVTKSRIEENFNIFDFQLSDADVAELDAINRNSRNCVSQECSTHPEYPFSIEY